MQGNTTNRKPHANHEGYVCELRNTITGIGHVIIYDGKRNDMGTEGGRWITACNTHSNVVASSSLPLARAAMKYPDFCEECMQVAIKDILRP